MNKNMKIVVIGGSGIIGSKVVTNLRQRGHEAVPASPSSGVNTLTGEGLTEALAGAQVVVDVANSPSFEDKACFGLLRNVRSQSSCRGNGRGGETSRGTFRGRHGSLAWKWARFPKWLLPREDGPGKSDQGFRDPVYDRARDAVLRVREEHSSTGSRRFNNSVIISPYAANGFG